MPALTQSLSHPEREGDSWSRGGGQQEQPQASLFSMAFYSYVILLLTHIGIGAVAYGGGGQRRARILSKGAQREVGWQPCLPPAQAASLAEETFPLLLSSPLTSSLANCNRGVGRWLLDPISTLTHHLSAGDSPLQGCHQELPCPKEAAQKLGCSA